VRAFHHILSLLFITLFCSISAFAQGQGAPESMNYQAVIRDGSANVLASQTVGLRIKILQGSSSGSSVYEETFAPTTNAYGSIAIQVGTGTVVSGTFNTIDWGANSHFVETAVDISGGTNYTVISTTQLMSVPYAMYAKTAGSSPADNDWTESGSNVYRSSGNVGIGTTSPIKPLSVELNDGISSGEHILANFSRTTPISNVGGLYLGYFADGTDETGGILRSTGNKPLYVGTFSSKQLLTLNGLNVGINNISPAYNLDVNGDINLTGSLRVNGVAQTFGGSSSLWAELSGNAYRTSGNIGIGTANPEWNLDIKSGTTTEGGIVQLSNSNDAHLLRVFSGSSSDPNPFIMWKTGDPLRFSTSSGIDNDGSWQEHMRINSNGNVGIGTSSPTSLLQISDGNAQGPTFKIDGLSPSILLQDNSGVSNTVDNFEIRNNLGSLNFSYGDNSDANDDGFLSNTALSISNNGTTRVTNLAGTGDRMVVADADGDLSTQAIPSAGSSMPNGSNNGDMMYWDGSAWQTIAVGSAGAVLQIIGGVPTWVSSPDINGPTITLNGNANMNVVVGGTFTDPGATTDEGTISTSGTVDVTTAGSYTITYSATDATGNTATATRTVEVYQSVFNYTGSAQTFTVPTDVTSISVDAYGASSSVSSGNYAGYCGSGYQAKGGRVQTSLSVTPGQTLYIYVGGMSVYCYSGSNNCLPLSNQAGGWNGGGNGSGNGEAGGGATDIRLGGTSMSDRVIVAGGAGGAGSYCTNGGGHGGGLTAGNGTYDNSYYGSSNGYGYGGSQSSGGNGGYNVHSNVSAGDGSLGQGGNGVQSGGGGGGGYYGGGAGAYEYCTGGGGSSYTHPTLCSSVVHTQGVQTGSGQLIITVP